VSKEKQFHSDQSYYNQNNCAKYGYYLPGVLLKKPSGKGPRVIPVIARRWGRWLGTDLKMSYKRN